MKRNILIFLISLLSPILSFSQNTSYPKVLDDSLVVITANQLKQTNLIFIDRDRLSEEVNWYDEQLTKYKLVTTDMKQVIKNDKEIIRSYEDETNALNQEINYLYVKNSRQRKIIEYKGVGLVALSVLSVVLWIL